MELVRRSPRFSVQCPVTYSSQLIGGLGTVTNLSTRGCKINSTMNVQSGLYLELRIYIPDSTMRVDRAEVHWSSGQQFGLKFLRMRPEEQERLSRYISALESSFVKK